MKVLRRNSRSTNILKLSGRDFNLQSGSTINSDTVKFVLSV